MILTVKLLPLIRVGNAHSKCVFYSRSTSTLWLPFVKHSYQIKCDDDDDDDDCNDDGADDHHHHYCYSEL